MIDKAKKVSVKRVGHDFTDGELLLCVGGPRDGKRCKVSILFPDVDGGVPSTLLRFGDDWYELDAIARQWAYKGQGYPGLRR